MAGLFVYSFLNAIIEIDRFQNFLQKEFWTVLYDLSLNNCTNLKFYLDGSLIIIWYSDNRIAIVLSGSGKTKNVQIQNCRLE